jgi:hypothetical protein
VLLSNKIYSYVAFRTLPMISCIPDNTYFVVICVALSLACCQSDTCPMNFNI